MWDHVVRPGENLWLISQRFKKDFNEIKRLNPQIRDKAHVWAGLIVHMPDPSPEGQTSVGKIEFNKPEPFGRAAELHDSTTYFVKPSWTNSAGATSTAENRLWRQELNLGGSAAVGLKGWRGVKLDFDHPDVVSFTSFLDYQNDLLGIDLVGVKSGDVDFIASRDGRPVASMQVHVSTTPVAKPIYLDSFYSGFYDINFRHEGGNYSKYLILHYLDDVSLAIHMDRISTATMDGGAAQKMIDDAPMGEGGRRVPAQLNASTTPNLVRLKALAVDQMNVNTYNIIRASAEAVIFVLAVGEAARALIKIPVSRAPQSVRRILGPGQQTLRDQARRLVTQIRSEGRTVIVNIGGTGEEAGAINVNPMRGNAGGRAGAQIPQLIQAPGEEVGELFDAASVDRVVSNNVPGGTINWSQAARGSHQILRPGGRIIIAPNGRSAPDLAAIQTAFGEAGFRDIQLDPVAKAFVSATK